MKKVIFLLITFLFFLNIVKAEPIYEQYDLQVLNSTLNKDFDVVVYEIIEVYFDHTFNNMYIKTKIPLNLHLSNEKEFGVWDLKVEINNKQTTFIPRPRIDKINGKYYFDYYINGINNESLIKISYFSNNILNTRSKRLYPFDKYEVFLLNRTISGNASNVLQISYPKTNTKMNWRSTPTKFTSDIGIEKLNKVEAIIKDLDIEIETKPILLNESNKGISSEVGLYDKKVIPEIKPYIPKTGKAERIDLEMEVENITNIYYGNFERPFIPSKFLFLLVGSWVIFLTFYSFRHREFKEKVNEIYIKASLPIIFAEFTVTILPPSRPLTFTLFDSIILWPFGIFLIKFIREEYRRQYRRG